MNTAFTLMAIYGPRPMIPLEEVRKEFFANLTPSQFNKQLGVGKIPLPVIRVTNSLKTPKFIHLGDLAAWIDKGMRVSSENFGGRRKSSRAPVNGFVYFVKSGEFVKIGFSIKPKGRANSFLCGNPYDIELLRVIEGTRETEKSFHRRFREYWHRLEWFRLEGELKAWLESDNAALA